jgi:hypothetical protein
MARPDRRHAGEALQFIENANKKVGVKLGITTFFAVGAPLSEQIYKICTLLSTAIVENRRARRRPATRKPFADAGSRGALGEPEGGGR